MRRILTGPTAALVALAMTYSQAWPSQAWAATANTAVGPDASDDQDDEDIEIVDDEEMEGGDGKTPPPPGATPQGDDLGLDLDEEGDGATDVAPEDAEQEVDSEAKQLADEERDIKVIQRQRMLKKGRFELTPQVGITVNDPYVRHYTVGLDLNYWIKNRMAIGITGTGLIGALTPRYKNIRFQEGLLLTANETLWQASANFTYNAFYGKIAIFNRALLHWEGSLVAGGGALQTRVIPRYDAIHDSFSTITGGGHFGIVGRFYVPKLDWLSVNFGTRAWVYPDKLEPINRGPGDASSSAGDDPALADPALAKDAASTEIAFNVTFFLGISFFFPTSFKYSTGR